MKDNSQQNNNSDLLILSDEDWALKIRSLMAGHHLEMGHLDVDADLESRLTASLPLMILVHSPTDVASIRFHLLPKLKEQLREKGTYILVVAPTLEVIKAWKELGLPNLYFHPSKNITNEMKGRILSLLSESLWMERPLVGVVGSCRLFMEEARLQLKNYGFRILPIEQTSSGSAIEAAIKHDLRVVLWEEGFGHESQIKQTLLDNYVTPIFVSASSVEMSHNSAQGKAIDIRNVAVWMGAVYAAYPNFKQVQPGICRDANDGLYLPELFQQVLGREMALAERHQESFSILRIRLQNKKQLHDHYGFLFARELEFNLGLFVKNHTRSSDLITKNTEGDILLLLSRTRPEKACLVGERLLHGFNKLVAFMAPSADHVTPSIAYKTYVFGLDFNVLDEVMGLLMNPVLGEDVIQNLKRG